MGCVEQRYANEGCAENPLPVSLWYKIRQEANSAIETDSSLFVFFQETILKYESLEEALLNRLADCLYHADIEKDVLVRNFFEAMEKIEDWPKILQADLYAVLERDPATSRLLGPVLYLKGFHAIQVHRLAHALWKEGRKDFAYYLQSRSSCVFQTDIHPAAYVGRGVFLDHATGLVVGETAQIENNVSILHGVTLGGTGKINGDRHPKIREGVLIGAGAKILGNIEVGCRSRVAAGSVLLSDVPAHVTVAGVPARIIGKAGCQKPAQRMDHTFSYGDGI